MTSQVRECTEYACDSGYVMDRGSCESQAKIEARDMRQLERERAAAPCVLKCYTSRCVDGRGNHVVDANGQEDMNCYGKCMTSCGV